MRRKDISGALEVEQQNDGERQLGEARSTFDTTERKSLTPLSRSENPFLDCVGDTGIGLSNFG